MGMSIKEQFAQNGYVILSKLFTSEEVRLLKEEAGKIIEKQGTNKNGVHLGLTIASPLFKKAAAHPSMVVALQQIIGNDVIFLSDKIVYKDSKTDFGSPWHQDYPYWNGSHKFSVWIALDDAAPENGCLKVIPGSHLLEAAHQEDHAANDLGAGFIHRLTEEDIDPARAIDLAAFRGDAIIFHDLLFHSSYPNTSGKDRWALISTYKDGTLEDPAYEWAGGAFAVSG